MSKSILHLTAVSLRMLNSNPNIVGYFPVMTSNRHKLLYTSSPSKITHQNRTPCPKIMAISNPNTPGDKWELRKAFYSAKSGDEMLEAFRAMEASFKQEDLGSECWQLAEKFHREGQYPKKVISYAKRAYEIFMSNGEDSGERTISLALLLHLIGCGANELKMYDDSLNSLNQGFFILTKLLGECDSDVADVVLQVLVENQYELFKVKLSMGRREEAVFHMKNMLEYKKRTVAEGSLELGIAYKEVSDAYFGVSYEESLQYCLKALEIHIKHLGPDSVEVAQLRRHLGVVYNNLGAGEKALEQIELSQNVLKDMDDKFLEMEVEKSYILNRLGRHEKAIDTLKGVISNPDARRGVCALAFVSTALAFYYLEKYAETKKYMESAKEIFEEEEMPPTFVSHGFSDLSVLYEKMGYYKTAISLLRRSMIMPNLPPALLLLNSKRLFRLATYFGQEKEGLPYLEDSVERLKECFGPDHHEVGRGYFMLGKAHMALGRSPEGVKHLEKARDIMESSLGHSHLDTLEANEHLSLAYADVKRYELAISCQEMVVRVLEELGPGLEDRLEAAVAVLNKIKELARTSQ